MGCASSTAAASAKADVGSATKRFFHLEDLPLTVQAVPAKDERFLHVRAAGLDKCGLLGALSAGFLKRNFLITDASVYAARGLFNAKFELKMQDESLRVQDLSHESEQQLAEELSHVEIAPLPQDLLWTSEASPTRTYQKGQKLVLDDVRDVKVSTEDQIEEIDNHAAGAGAVMRLSLTRGWTPFIRVALQGVIEAAGLRVVAARLSTTVQDGRFVIKDTFWLAEVSVGDALGARNASAWMADLIEQIENARPAASPSKFFERQTSPEEVQDEVGKAARNSFKARLAAMPQALRAKAKELCYELDLDAEGEQYKGLRKYTGIGMAKTYRGADVLEFATYCVREEGPERKTSLSGRMDSLLGSGDKFGEVITQYDPTKRCLTVFKVFLNGVLPSGEAAGARLVAEQLAQKRIHDMYGADWHGQEAMQKLNKIILCDVVNWNTYALMSMAGTMPQSETERLLIGEEARAAGLTLADLKMSTVDDVFPQTALGKLVTNVLKIWAEKGMVRKAIAAVNVRMERSQMELINGEYRQMMDIAVTLR